MITLSFLLMLTGLCLFTGGVLGLTLYIAGSGKWPGFHPRHWDNRLKKLVLGTGGGLILALAGGVIAMYGI